MNAGLPDIFTITLYDRPGISVNSALPLLSVTFVVVSGLVLTSAPGTGLSFSSVTSMDTRFVTSGSTVDFLLHPIDTMVVSTSSNSAEKYLFFISGSLDYSKLIYLRKRFPPQPVKIHS